MMGFVGVNGVGKMMMMWMIVGVFKFIFGQVLWLGRLIMVEDCCIIGYMFEERGFYFKQLVIDQFVYFV